MKALDHRSRLLKRREFVVLSVLAGSHWLVAQRGTQVHGQRVPLPRWSPGILEIHHIDTGRGNATFILGPDGTTILIDCGSVAKPTNLIAPARPNGSLQPAEWVAQYALRRAALADRGTLDFMVATHVHPDHVGDISEGAHGQDGATFIATGLSQVDALMPAAIVIDRAYPDYGLLPPQGAFARNYLDWLRSRARTGRSVQALRVGSASQITLRTRYHGTPFLVRGLAANGRVWTGTGEETRSVFPDLSTVDPLKRPTENSCSIALRLQYGRFSYFTGGDLTADTHDERQAWLDVESPATKACGPVDVAVADHHGYFDACGPQFVRNLRAQVYVVPSWHVSHPGMAQLERLEGAWPLEPHHDVFLLEMLPANRDLNSRWLKELRSTLGHVVIQVAADGESYRVFVLDSREEASPVVSVSPVYESVS